MLFHPARGRQYALILPSLARAGSCAAFEPCKFLEIRARYWLAKC